MKLKNWLQTNDLSTADFAAIIGVSQPTIYRYMNGVQYPSRKYLLAIKKHTGGQVTPNDFLTEDVA